MRFATLRKLQSWLRHLPVATKLSINLVVILVLLGGVATAVFVNATRQVERLRVLASRDVPLIREVNEIEINANETIAALLIYLDTSDTLSFARQRQDRAELGAHLRAYRNLTRRTPGVGSRRMDSLTLEFDAVASRAIVTSQLRRRTLRDFGVAATSLIALVEGHRGSARPHPARDAVRQHVAMTWQYLASQDPALLDSFESDTRKLRHLMSGSGVEIVPARRGSRSQLALASAFARYLTLATRLVALQREEQEHVRRIGQIRRMLDTLLDEVVQAPVERRINLAVSATGREARIQTVLTLATLVAGLFIAAVAAERLAKEINDPLTELVRVAEKMRGGDLDQVVRLDSSREFNTLGESFNRMAERLHDSLSELKLAAASAEAASTEKSRFVSDVSHEMRTPLTSLRGSLILLANNAVEPASDTGKKLLQVAIGSTDRLIRMINDRLDLDKIEGARSDDAFRPVQLAEVVRDGFHEVGGLAGMKEIALRVEGQAPAVLGDHDRLVQVLVNLLGNALKFSPPGATICVTVEEEGQCARVSVSDAGPGVLDSDQHRIFMRFEQASEGETASGTGLGLAIAREIVEEHRGTIGVESSAGSGAKFWFTLPLADAE